MAASRIDTPRSQHTIASPVSRAGIPEAPEDGTADYFFRVRSTYARTAPCTGADIHASSTSSSTERM